MNACFGIKYTPEYVRNVSRSKVKQNRGKRIRSSFELKTTGDNYLGTFVDVNQVSDHQKTLVFEKTFFLPLKKLSLFLLPEVAS